MSGMKIGSASPASSKLKRWLVFGVLLALVSLSCICSTESLPEFITDFLNREDDQELPAEEVSGVGILMQDDFSDPNSGWEIGEFDSGSIGYKGGRYFVISTQRSTAMWGTAGQLFKDVVIEVNAIQVRAPNNKNNDFGVMCRVKLGGGGYSFNISGDGFYSIQKAENDQYINLVEWTESSAIRTGNAENHIRAVCDGEKLVFFVNGTLLAEVSDSTYSEGDIALAATTYETEATEIHFDNLVVRKP